MSLYPSKQGQFLETKVDDKLTDTLILQQDSIQFYHKLNKKQKPGTWGKNGDSKNCKVVTKISKIDLALQEFKRFVDCFWKC